MPAGDRGFFWLLVGYVALHALLRLLVSPVVTIDDARETVLGQTLAWGYQPRQPPLYNWLVWGAFQILGVGVLALTVVKYAVLAGAYAFVYLSARRVLADGRLAILATGSLLLLLPVSWAPHEALTHSIAVLAASAATFHLLLRLGDRGSPGAYLALGAALGLGMLSKFTYGVFALALLGAALTVPRFRARLLHPRSLLALVVATALVLPYALWFTRHGFAFLAMATTQMGAGLGETPVHGVLSGLYYVARVALYYSAPLGVVLLVLFPGVYAVRLPSPGQAPAEGRLLERFFLCVLALLVAAALGRALTYLKFRWMLPAFFLLPLYAFSRLARAGGDERRLRRLAGVLVAAEAAVVAGILVSVYTGSLGGRPNPLNEPYDAIAAGLAGSGFKGGTIVAGPGALGGNLRLRFPDARVISLENPYYVPPRPVDAADGQCLVAWERDGLAAVPPDLRDFLAAALDVRLTGQEPVRVAEASYRHAPDHLRRVAYLLFPQGAAHCR